MLDRIDQDIKIAMKAKDSASISTLRLLKSALKNKQIELQRALQEQDVQEVLKTQIKQLKESMESFSAGGRQEMVAAAEKEIVILQRYAPSQLNDEELARVVKDAVRQSGAASKDQIGQAMGAAMKAVGTRADGGRVKMIVETLLAVFILVFAAPQAHAAISAAMQQNSGSLEEQWLTLILRLLRVILLVFAILFVNLVLMGGFKYMVATGRDDERNSGLRHVSMGMVGTTVILTLFGAVSVIIQKMA